MSYGYAEDFEQTTVSSFKDLLNSIAVAASLKFKQDFPSVNEVLEVEFFISLRRIIVNSSTKSITYTFAELGFHEL